MEKERLSEGACVCGGGRARGGVVWQARDKNDTWRQQPQHTLSHLWPPNTQPPARDLGNLDMFNPHWEGSSSSSSPNARLSYCPSYGPSPSLRQGF